MYICEKKEKSNIVFHRRTKHSDLPDISKLIRMKTYDVFGTIDNARVYEQSLLSLVQLNANQEIVSSVHLFNYPNVPSVPPNDWICWIRRHYGLEYVSLGNSMFIHFLVWDTRYTNGFLNKLLSAIFSMATFCHHVILIHPPCVAPVSSIEKYMRKIPPKGEQDSYKVQTIYIASRNEENFKLKIRLAVEEDNDDIVRIIDAETKKLKEHYGEYYISEMIRYSDDQRKIIVAEIEGVVKGVMCLNKVVDINLLNEVFELGPYNGLKKLDENESRIKDDLVEVESLFDFPDRTDNTQNHFKRKTGGVVKGNRKQSYKSDEDCQCYHHYSPKTGELCPDCFLEVQISKTTIDFGFLEEKKETEAEGAKFAQNTIEILEDFEDKKERTEGNESDESDIETEEIEENIEDIAIEIKEGGEENEVKKGEKIERNSSEKIKLIEEINETEKEFVSSPLAEEKRENIIYKNTKVKNFFQVAFDLLLRSNDDGQNSGLNQLLLAQSTNLQSKLRISLFADTLSGMSSKRDTTGVSTLKVKEYTSSHPTSIFEGESNVFVLEIFSRQKDLDEQKCQEFLKATFECFSGLDYCVMLLPTTHHFFPFMENFTRVPLRFNMDFPMALYLAHRAVFFGTFESRQAVSYDLQKISEFIHVIPGRESILKNCEEAILKFQTQNNCYIFLCDDILIGLAIVSFEKEINFLLRHYHIEDYLSIQNIPIDGHGRLIHFIIMPIFSVYQQFFYRELLRLTEMTILYYRLYESDASALTRTHPLVNCLNTMISVEPRIRNMFSFQHYFEKNGKSPISCQEEEQFSLFLMTPHYTTILKPVINTKIVVVGASDCGLAFIEFLALRSKINSANFTNLTLISTNGLPFEKKRPCFQKKFIIFRGRYCHAYRNLTGGRAWFNIITGTVIGINRKEKYVTIHKLGHLTYDYLILTCGLQFQKPKLSKDIENQEKENPTESITPINCLSINDDTEVDICVKNLLIWTNNLSTQKSIVFYGRSIQSYCALNAFLEMGIKGNWITLIEPSVHGCQTHEKIFFDDTEVDTTVMSMISKSGVEIFSGWDMIDWELKDVLNGDKIITNLKIESNSETKTVPCDIFISFSEKRIKLETFLAFSHAGLVFDGLLIIDPEYRTNDPFIFAAGTVTKYSRKYLADSWKHTYFNSIEVGERLAKNLIKIIETYHDEDERPVNYKSKIRKTLPVFKTPTCISCLLPGGYYYLHVHKPGQKMQRRLAILQKIYGNVYVTGSCTSDIGYFRLRINTFGSVETFTCFSKKSFEILNLISLYGKHESMLNNFSIRFQNSLIIDFYEYFREPWATALFSDRFDCYRVENRAILLSKHLGGESLIDDILKALMKSNWDQISKEDRKNIESRFVGSIYQEKIEKSLIDFLQYFEDDLPMYCTPQKVRQILGDFEDSPLFTPQ